MRSTSALGTLLPCVVHSVGMGASATLSIVVLPSELRAEATTRVCTRPEDALCPESRASAERTRVIDCAGDVLLRMNEFEGVR